MFLYDFWGTVKDVASWLPFTGTITSGIDTYNSFSDGDTTRGIINAGVTLVSAAFDVFTVASFGAGAPIEAGVMGTIRNGVKKVVLTGVEKEAINLAEKQGLNEIVRIGTEDALKVGAEKFGQKEVENLTGKQIIDKLIDNAPKEIDKLSEQELKNLGVEKLGQVEAEKLSTNELRVKMRQVAIQEVDKQVRDVAEKRVATDYTYYKKLAGKTFKKKELKGLTPKQVMDKLEQKYGADLEKKVAKIKSKYVPETLFQKGKEFEKNAPNKFYGKLGKFGYDWVDMNKWVWGTEGGWNPVTKLWRGPKFKMLGGMYVRKEFGGYVPKKTGQNQVNQQQQNQTTQQQHPTDTSKFMQGSGLPNADAMLKRNMMNLGGR